MISGGRAELVNLDATVETLQLGDVTLTGALFEIRSTFGAALELSFSGGITVGTQVDLTGSVDASFGPNGTLISLRGDVSGQLNLEGFNIRNLNASVVATPQQVAVTGSGKLSLAYVPLEVTFGGTYTSSAGIPNWSLTGSGRFRIALIDVASANFVLQQGQTMQAVRVGFHYTVLGIFPSYVEATFHMLPTGCYEQIKLTAWGDELGKALVILRLSALLPPSCPVS